MHLLILDVQERVREFMKANLLSKAGDEQVEKGALGPGVCSNTREGS